MENGSNKKVITVNASSVYDVVVGAGLLDEAGELISGVMSPCKIALITDDIVDKLYSKQVINSIENAGFSAFKFVFAHGEQSKNLNTYGQILEFLAQNQLTRTDAVVALGGGVVGDMAGFAAATFLRGIKYIQIPTTLLAQIDSSVGGKTAIDLPTGKNLVGAFCQPKLVICDTNTLKTLPKEILLDGMGEAAKYAILDQKIFDLIESDYEKKDLVLLCVDYKRKVVEEDEFERGIRKLLNLGHTLAHGIEKLSEYKFSHGKAVAIGLKIILENSFRHKLIDEKTYQRAIYVVEKCVGKIDCPFAVKDMCKVALSDKKRNGDCITVIMVFGIGDCKPVPIDIEQLWGYLT